MALNNRGSVAMAVLLRSPVEPDFFSVYHISNTFTKKHYLRSNVLKLSSQGFIERSVKLSIIFIEIRARRFHFILRLGIIRLPCHDNANCLMFVFATF